VGEFLIHWLSLLLILTLPMMLAVTLAFRIGHLVTNEQFNADVNAMNALEPWLYGNDTYEPDDEDAAAEAAAMTVLAATEALEEVAMTARQRTVPYRFLQGNGTHLFFRSVTEYQRRNDRRDDAVETERSLHELYEDHTNVYNRVRDPGDSAEYDADTAAYHLHIIDSIETHFPLLRTQLGSFTPHERWPGRDMDTDSVIEVNYVQRFNGPGMPDAATIQAVLQRGRFYSPNVRLLDPAAVLAEFTAREASTTSLWSAENTISDMAEAKAYDYEFLAWEAILYGMLLSCFGLALLLSVFKNLYWQPFLMAVVTAAVLPILILIFSLITAEAVFELEEEHVMLWTYYLLVLGILAVQVRVPMLKAYRPVPAVLNILANVAAPVFPLFTLFLLNERFDVFGSLALEMRIEQLEMTDHDPLLLNELSNMLYTLNQRIFLYMQVAGWGGVLFYTFALHPLFRWCQTRLMALPERR
jgi:hypothetical protein